MFEKSINIFINLSKYVLYKNYSFFYLTYKCIPSIALARTFQTNPWTSDVKKWITTNLQKCSTQKPNTNNTAPNGGKSRKKYNIQGDIKTLLGKNCVVEKMMRFLKEMEMYEEIIKWGIADKISLPRAVSYIH